MAGIRSFAANSTMRRWLAKFAAVEGTRQSIRTRACDEGEGAGVVRRRVLGEQNLYGQFPGDSRGGLLPLCGHFRLGLEIGYVGHPGKNLLEELHLLRMDL